MLCCVVLLVCVWVGVWFVLWCGVVCADGRVASGSVDGTIRVWGVGLNTPHPIVSPNKALVIRKHKHSVRCLTVLPGTECAPLLSSLHFTSLHFTSLHLLLERLHFDCVMCDV